MLVDHRRTSASKTNLEGGLVASKVITGLASDHSSELGSFTIKGKSADVKEVIQPFHKSVLISHVGGASLYM